MQKHSNAELKTMLKPAKGQKGEWKFPQTLALVNYRFWRGGSVVFAARAGAAGIRDPMTRLFGRTRCGWFYELAVKINDYDPEPPRRSAAARSAPAGWD